MKPNYVHPLDLRNGRVDLNHGAGGRAMAQLIEELFARAVPQPFVDPLSRLLAPQARAHDAGLYAKDG